LPKSPWADVTEIPGDFRISLTAGDAMIERGLPGFAAALEHACTFAAPNAAPSAATGGNAVPRAGCR
jgi:hypothetical protein